MADFVHEEETSQVTEIIEVPNFGEAQDEIGGRHTNRGSTAFDKPAGRIVGEARGGRMTSDLH